MPPTPDPISSVAPAPPRDADAEQARPLRVLMVLESDFSPRGGGGAESQVRTLAQRLRKTGRQASVITPNQSNKPQPTAERCAGIPVGRFRYPQVPFVGAVAQCLRFTLFLVGHGRRYDAWHVHIGHYLGAVTCLVGSIIGKPVVVKISGSWELEHGILAPGRRRLRNEIGRRWLQRAGVVQAISTRIAGELSKRGFPPERILVLPNAVDTSRFRVRSTVRDPGAPFTALFVGRMVDEKDLATFFDAWAQAFAGRSDVRLRLVGGGPLETELRAQAERLGIAGQVEFLGHRDRVEEVLAEADLGVLTSRIEGLSNTLLEFMASGLPTLATRVSGSEDFVVTGRNGWLCAVSDAPAMAAALREAERMPPERLAAMGRQARADVEEAASLEVVVERLVALYRGARPRDLEKAA